MNSSLVCRPLWQLLLRGAVIMIQSQVRAHKARREIVTNTISTGARRTIMDLYIMSKPEISTAQRITKQLPMSRDCADMQRKYLSR